MGRDVLTIVQRLGWTHKVVHREVWIAPCPYCHDGDANPEKQVRGARGFSVNLDHGGGHCLACSWSGTILDLERDHGLVAPVLPFPDRGHERRSPDPPEPIVPPSMYQQGFSAYTAARDYLKSRGFEKDAVVAWKLGATIRRFGGEPFEAVAIPTLTEGGAPIGYKFRLVAPGEGPKYLKTKGTPQDLVGLHLLRHEDLLRPLVITEGELDAVTLWQAGVRPVVSIPSGADTWDHAWTVRAQRFPQVILAYDADDAGDAGAMKAAKAIGISRCRRAKPPSPHKDWNAALVAGLPAQALRAAILDNAQAWQPEWVVDLPSAVDEAIAFLRRDAELERVSSGITDLDAALGGGLAPGDITFVYGRTSHGKSTLALSILVNALTHGTPCLSLSGEYIEPHHVRLLAGQRLGKHGFAVGADELAIRRDVLDSLPLRIVRSGRQFSFEEIANTLKWANGEGVRLAVFDPIDWLVPDNPKSSGRYADIAAYVRSLLGVVKALDLHLVVVFPVNKAGSMVGEESQRHAAWNILRVVRDEGNQAQVAGATGDVEVVIEKARRVGHIARRLKLRYLRDGARIVDPDDVHGTGVPF